MRPNPTAFTPVRRRCLRTALWALVLGLAAPLALAVQFTDLEGRPATLESHLGDGRWTVVMIWASDCHVCNAEVHNYNDFHVFHQDRDARVLGISIDGAAGRDDARAFVRRHELAFPNLLAEPGDVARWYMELTGSRWVGTPTFLIYSPAGELRAQQAGAVPTGLIEDFLDRQRQAAVDSRD